jgi:hypothetical protein
LPGELAPVLGSFGARVERYSWWRRLWRGSGGTLADELAWLENEMGRIAMMGLGDVSRARSEPSSRGRRHPRQVFAFPAFCEIARRRCCSPTECQITLDPVSE